MKRLAATAAAVALAACGPVVDKVDVSPPTLTLSAVGATAQLAATPRAPDGKPLAIPVRWTSLRPEVAEVDGRGRVTARRTGEAQVAAEAGGTAGRATVTVSVPSRAALAPAALELVGVPASGKLALALSDEAGRSVAAREVAWSSSDEKVARVADGGAVTAVGTGRATVSARSAGLTASAEVTVRLPEFARIAVRPPRLVLPAGGTARVEAEAVDGAGRPVAGVPIGWASSDGAVVRVAPDGAVAAVAKGRARLVASGGGRSAAVDVTVRR
jgi:hypothetical protein